MRPRIEYVKLREIESCRRMTIHCLVFYPKNLLERGRNGLWYYLPIYLLTYIYKGFLCRQTGVKFYRWGLEYD